mmetsp:Transcript_26543/g.68526  ORF Transcript_26543/g.68526 Transcript_26543/m.68526 type:complete len:299 (+) Transcript_26543:186-1082(+)
MGDSGGMAKGSELLGRLRGWGQRAGGSKLLRWAARPASGHKQTVAHPVGRRLFHTSTVTDITSSHHMSSGSPASVFGVSAFLPPPSLGMRIARFFFLGVFAGEAFSWSSGTVTGAGRADSTAAGSPASTSPAPSCSSKSSSIWSSFAIRCLHTERAPHAMMRTQPMMSSVKGSALSGCGPSISPISGPCPPELRMPCPPCTGTKTSSSPSLLTGRLGLFMSQLFSTATIETRAHQLASANPVARTMATCRLVHEPFHIVSCESTRHVTHTMERIAYACDERKRYTTTMSVLPRATARM